jgi:hypothetical protein
MQIFSKRERNINVKVDSFTFKLEPLVAVMIIY